jgi:hypothetical protein
VLQLNSLLLKSQSENPKTLLRHRNGLIVSANSDSQPRGVTDAPMIAVARRVPIGMGWKKTT